VSRVVRSGSALALALVAALAWSEELPPELVERIDAYQAACMEIDAKAEAKLATEREALAKGLNRIAEREKRAGRAEVADEVVARLGQLSPSALLGAAGERGWKQFLTACRVTSQGLKQVTARLTAAACSIEIGTYAFKPQIGLNVVVFQGGKAVLERTYSQESDCRTGIEFDLTRQPDGAFVVMAVNGGFKTGKEHATLDAMIRRCGGKHVFTGLIPGYGYILIGRLGSEPGTAVELVATGGELLTYPAAKGGAPDGPAKDSEGPVVKKKP
jgi:hypothetical protein